MTIGLALTAVSAVVGIASQRKQQKAQRKAQKEQEKASMVEEARARRENLRGRRQQLREARFARADVVGRGAQQGVLGSSGVQGGISSIGSQSATNISDINVNEGFTMARNSFLDNAQRLQNDAAQTAATGQMFQSALSLGSTGYKEYKSATAGNQGNAQFLKNNPSYAGVMGK